MRFQKSKHFSMLACLIFMSSCVKQRGYLDSKGTDKSTASLNSFVDPSFEKAHWSLKIGEANRQAMSLKIDAKTKTLIREVGVMSLRVLLAQERQLKKKKKVHEQPTLRDVYRFHRKRFDGLIKQINNGLTNKKLKEVTEQNPSIVDYKFLESGMSFGYSVAKESQNSLALVFSGVVKTENGDVELNQVQSSHVLRLLKQQSSNWFRKLDSRTVSKIKVAGELQSNEISVQNKNDTPQEALEKLSVLLGNSDLLSKFQLEARRHLVASSLQKALVEIDTFGKKLDDFSALLAYSRAGTLSYDKLNEEGTIWEGAIEKAVAIENVFEGNGPLKDELIEDALFTAYSDDDPTEEEINDIVKVLTSKAKKSAELLREKSQSTQPYSSKFTVYFEFELGTNSDLAKQYGMVGQTLSIDVPVSVPSITKHQFIEWQGEPHVRLTFDPLRTAGVVDGEKVTEFFQALKIN